MKNFIKNTTLLVVILLLSYITANYFGYFYDYLFPLYDNTLGLGAESLQFIIGLPLSYIFLTVLTFQICGSGPKKKWMIWLLAPAALFFLLSDIRHIYFPIILGLIAYGLARLLQLDS